MSQNLQNDPPYPRVANPLRRLQRAVHREAAAGNTEGAALLRQELRVAPLDPEVISVKSLGSRVRTYGVRYRLRTKALHVTPVSVGAERSEQPDLNDLGWAAAQGIIDVIGVDYVLIRPYEIYVALSDAFEWEDNLGIHDQILALLLSLVSLDSDSVEIWYRNTLPPGMAPEDAAEESDVTDEAAEGSES
ncbi:MAG: hypothetical protein K0S68_699 [Candidatus Saccharibacteria bacterium]|nr:hypothetical protein [Candidatus Saccharibacteria bacterium]